MVTCPASPDLEHLTTCAILAPYDYQVDAVNSATLFSLETGLAAVPTWPVTAIRIISFQRSFCMP